MLVAKRQKEGTSKENDVFHCAIFEKLASNN